MGLFSEKYDKTARARIDKHGVTDEEIEKKQ